MQRDMKSSAVDVCLEVRSTVKTEMINHPFISESSKSIYGKSFFRCYLSVSRELTLYQSSLPTAGVLLEWHAMSDIYTVLST